jgi:hypothetical protein
VGVVLARETPVAPAANLGRLGEDPLSSPACVLHESETPLPLKLKPWGRLLQEQTPQIQVHDAPIRQVP